MSYVLLFTFHAFVVHCCLFSSWWLLAFLISHCCYFHVFFPTKKVSFVFSFRSSCLSLFFWLSFADLLPTFSLSLYSKFVDMTIYLSLILWTTRMQKQFPLSVFVFNDSLLVSSSQNAGGYAISRQNNLELPYLLTELFYIGMPVVRMDCRSLYGHVITKFSRKDRFTKLWGSARVECPYKLNKDLHSNSIKHFLKICKK